MYLILRQLTVPSVTDSADRL